MQKRKDILSKNIPIKITSLFFAYIFWCILSNEHIASYWITVPLCFYNNKHAMEIDAPETIAINIRGRRTDLWNLATENLAAHINLEHMQPGKQIYNLSASDLLLPETIHLVHYKPSNIICNLTKTPRTTTKA